MGFISDLRKKHWKISIVILVMIFILVIISFVYKNLATIVSYVFLLLFVWTLFPQKNNEEKKIYTIATAFSIVLLIIPLYEEIKNDPFLDISIHSFKLEETPSTIKDSKIPKNVFVDIINAGNTYMLYFTERVRNPSDEINLNFINPLQDSICTDCIWYQYTVRSEGKLDFPIYIYLFSTKSVYLRNKDPRIEFNCGDGIFSEGICLITIKNMEKEIKLVFYTKEDLKISSIYNNIEYIERIYHSSLFVFGPGEFPDFSVDKKTKVEFPPFTGECVHYTLISGNFVEKEKCKFW